MQRKASPIARYQAVRNKQQHPNGVEGMTNPTKRAVRDQVVFTFCQHRFRDIAAD